MSPTVSKGPSMMGTLWAGPFPGALPKPREAAAPPHHHHPACRLPLLCLRTGSQGTTNQDRRPCPGHGGAPGAEDLHWSCVKTGPFDKQISFAGGRPGGGRRCAGGGRGQGGRVGSGSPSSRSQRGRLLPPRIWSAHSPSAMGTPAIARRLDWIPLPPPAASARRMENARGRGVAGMRWGH